MKKIINTIIFLSAIVFFMDYSSYGASSTVKTNIKKTELKENKIQAEISISDLENVGEGINAYSGELIFDSDQLTLVDVKGTELWNIPVYNGNKTSEGILKVVSTSNEFTKKEEQIFIATFEKRRTNISSDDIKFEFRNCEVAAKINGETVKIAENDKIEDSTSIKSETTSMIEDSKKEKNSKKSLWGVIGIVDSILIFTIGILVIGFGVYRKNKGGK